MIVWNETKGHAAEVFDVGPGDIMPDRGPWFVGWWWQECAADFYGTRTYHGEPRGPFLTREAAEADATA